MIEFKQEFNWPTNTPINYKILELNQYYSLVTNDRLVMTLALYYLTLYSSAKIITENRCMTHKLLTNYNLPVFGRCHYIVKYNINSLQNIAKLSARYF